MFNQFFHIVRLCDWSFSTCGRGGWSGERSGGDLAPEVSWRHRQRFHRWVLDDGVVRKLYTQVHSLLYNFVQCVPVAPPTIIIITTTTTTSNSWYYGFTSWFPFLVSVICLQFSTSSVAGVEALMGCCGTWAGPSSAAPVGSSETSGQIT